MGIGAAFQWTQPSTWPWVVWVWIAFLAVAWAPSLWRRLQRSRAASWPVADARIESVEVRKPYFPFTTRRGYYSADLGYSYAAAGSVYSGLYKRDLPSEREGEEFIRDLKGKPIPAHYNPNAPSRSVLLDSDIEALLQARAPAENDVADAGPFIPNWIRPFLWLFVMIATTGLALSLWVHIGAVVGRQVGPDFLFWVLHVGIFIVWVPAVFVAQKMVGGVNRKDLWKVALRNCPVWMKYMIYGFFGYAMINFLLFMTKTTSRTGGSPSPTEWRGFSGHWMAFYSAALGILYSAAVGATVHRRCANGHVLSADSPDYCARCGQPVERLR